MLARSKSSLDVGACGGGVGAGTGSAVASARGALGLFGALLIREAGRRNESDGRGASPAADDARRADNRRVVGMTQGTQWESTGWGLISDGGASRERSQARKTDHGYAPAV